MIQVGRGQLLVPEDPVPAVAGLADSEEHRVQVQDLVVVPQQVELLEPPPVGRPVADLPLAGNELAPGRELGRALDEHHPRVVLGGVLQNADRRRSVTLGPGDAGFVLGVLEVEQRQALFVRLLRVRLAVVDAADARSEEVCGGKVSRRVVVGGLPVDQVGDPVLSVRVVGLVNPHLVLVVVRRHDHVEAGQLDPLRETTEAREGVDSHEGVVLEPTSLQRRAPLCGAHDALPEKVSAATWPSLGTRPVCSPHKCPPLARTQPMGSSAHDGSSQSAPWLDRTVMAARQADRCSGLPPMKSQVTYAEPCSAMT